MYDYNARNLLTQERNALGNIWAYDYDGLGNRISRANPNEQGAVSVQYRYHPNNNLTHSTDRQQRVSDYRYDALKRLTEQTDALGRTVGYRYDAASRLLETRTTEANGYVDNGSCFFVLYLR